MLSIEAFVLYTVDLELTVAGNGAAVLLLPHIGYGLS
jgi:hypothetical protein